MEQAEKRELQLPTGKFDAFVLVLFTLAMWWHTMENPFLESYAHIKVRQVLELDRVAYGTMLMTILFSMTIPMLACHLMMAAEKQASKRSSTDAS